MRSVSIALLTLSAILFSIPATAQDKPGDSQPYRHWPRSGSLYLNTTPDGANLPAEASVEEFPVLVRLHGEFFDFAAAKPNGEDVRFSTPAGVPLPYQIEQWEAAKGEASLWVRVPKIAGNARQELLMHWGNAGAVSESNGKAVFNDSNGFLTVLHMGDAVKDETGSVKAEDEGTTATAGMIGTARHFGERQGIFCGEQNQSFPVGASPHSTEAWVRAERVNGRVMAWGNEHGQGKVVMHFMSPPHVKMECYFSGADVSSEGRMPLNDWVHVFHTYEKGDSRIYVNGVLSNASKTQNAPLAIKSPARLYIGGWYRNYDFRGTVDEVRISKLTRTADWVKLQYQNQKPLQTLTGPVVPLIAGLTGRAFSVSPAEATVAEGQSAAFTLNAPTAQKVYWILKSGGVERIAAVDRFAFTFDANRVTGDQAVTLQCRAVFADKVETREIAILVKETIPDPVFTLTAPKTWDGRATIEVTPVVTGDSAALKTEWSVGPFAVIKEITPGKLVLKRAQKSGPLTVSATVSNGGQPVTQSVDIQVTEPKSDSWVAYTPAKDEKPVEGQFFARDDKNAGTLHWNGALTETADAVFLKLYADDKLIKTETATPAADKSYALAVKLKPGLIRYKAEFGVESGGKEAVKETVGDLVCGDAFIIDGQSNALATDTGEKSPPETSEWIRSYGRPGGDEKANAGNLWCRPVWKAEKGEKAELGWWGMELAKQLVANQKVPVCIINAAVGGTRIDQHQRSTDLSTIYGRMLWRVRQAKLTHGIRAILWHQGENDQGSDGPIGGYGWETYQQLFVEMSAGWKQDFPNVQHYYVFQIWPDSCSMGGRNGSGDMLREKQRTLPQLYSNMSIMSTLGIVPPGPCHFPLIGWAEIANLVQPQMERDLYGKVFDGTVNPPNLLHAGYPGAAKDEVALQFDQPVKWKDELAGQFYLDGEKGHVASGSVAGNVLTLKLKVPSAATTITYLKEVDWNQMTLLEGANGIAALTFCKVPLTPAAGRR